LRKLTISLGIASMCGATMNAQDLMRRAERALAEAKRQGRDRAVACQEAIPDHDGN